jgi:HEAT repeat protein
MATNRFAITLLAVSLCGAVFAQQPSGDAKDRVRAARELAKQGTAGIPQLTQYLSDPDVDVRVEAVKSLVDVGTQHSLEPLLKATGDNDPEVQIRAAEGLVNFYYPGYIKTGWTSSLRRTGARLVNRFGGDTNDQIIDVYVKVRPEVIQALGRLARGGTSMDSRAAAARAIGVLRGDAALDDLAAALRTKDDTVIYEALVAMQKIRNPAAAPKMMFLLRDLDDKVQIAALETAGLLRNPEALPDLREVVGRARNVKVRRAALSAVAMIPDQANRSLFQQYFGDRDEGMRASAAEGFARIGAAADVAMIQKAFGEERKMNPRLSQAFALVALGDNATGELAPLTYLVNTLNSKSYRGVAQAFLVELLRKRENREAVYRILGQATKEEKIQLAQVLARSGDKDSVAPLESLARDTDAEVQQEAERALRNLKARTT